MNEIRISGFGGQGVIRCGYIIGKTAALFDGKHATLTQSFGPEARGSACSAQILVDDAPIRYPYITTPDTVVTMSQEAYDKFGSHITDDGVLLVDEDLVKPLEAVKRRKLYAVPATRIAEELGNRIVANIVMLGFFTAITDILTVDGAREALPSSVPERFVDLNLQAFERGYEYGLNLLGRPPDDRPKRGKRKTAEAAKPAPGEEVEKPAAKKPARKAAKKSPAKRASKKPAAKRASKKPAAKKASKKPAAKKAAKKPAAKKAAKKPAAKKASKKPAAKKAAKKSPAKKTVKKTAGRKK